MQQESTDTNNAIAVRVSNNTPYSIMPSHSSLPIPSTPLPTVKPTSRPTTIPHSSVPIPSTPLPTIKPTSRPTTTPHPTLITSSLEKQRVELAFELLRKGTPAVPRRAICYTPNVWGGFCNGFRAIRSLALLSLLNGYKLQSRNDPLLSFPVEWNQFFEVMDDRLKVFSSKCNRNGRYMASINTLLSDNNTKKLNYVWTNDISDPTPFIMRLSENGKKLVEMGLFDSIPTSDEVSHFISLVVFRLNSQLQMEADEAFSHYPHPLLGFQIRTGGSSANTHERVIFNSVNDTDAMISFVDTFVRDKAILNATIFLSTDSNEMVQAIRQQGKYRVITLDAYTIGHSSPRRNEKTTSSSLKRAVMDLYLLSKCDALITSESSSFGRTAYYLSSSSKKRTMALMSINW